MNTESELEIKIPLLIFKRIFYFAAIIKIIFCTWLNIEAHLWCNQVEHPHNAKPDVYQILKHHKI